MNTKDIITVHDQKIPTMVAYDFDNEEIIIGDQARIENLNGKSNIHNFKLDLGLSDKKFRDNPKYWYAIPNPDKKGSFINETFSSKKVITEYIKKLIKDVPIPDQIMVGVPSIVDEKWTGNFRSHMREVFEEISNDLGRKLKPDFFPEPFAVFQYYRHVEEIFEVKNEKENILIIDIGAGTFNSCIIQTTNDGYLSRGGANQKPLGLFSEEKGGVFVDKELINLIIEKAKKSGAKWKEDPLSRITNSKLPILLLVEDAKIKLSKQFRKNASLTTSHEQKKVEIELPKGSLHQEKAIVAEINGDEFRKILDHLWREHWAKIIHKTIEEAEEKTKSKINTLDRVIVAGGSSNLPFIRDEIEIALRQYSIDKKDIYIGKDPGNAVAFGLAAECRESSDRKPQLKVGTLAPCLITDLFFAFKKNLRRGSEYIIPKITLDGKSLKNGQLLNAPFEIAEKKIIYDVQFPYKPNGSIYYFFSKQPFSSNTDNDYLNINNTSVSIAKFGALNKKFKIELVIDVSGVVKTTFLIKESRARHKQDFLRLEGCEFYLDSFDVKEGESFLGIDFGTYNSYLARFINTEKKIKPLEYPEFTISKSVAEKSRKLEIDTSKFAKDNINISVSTLKSFLHNKKNEHVYQSNKIEGNPLSKGETEEIIDGAVFKNPTTHQLEAINLSNAFDWVLANFDSLTDTPQMFIREVHKLIMTGVKADAGTYREGPVKLAQMDFTPPPSGSISAYIDQLADEIKNGCEGRSILEFACSIHTKLVFIHPFSDGNGRTARLLMNAILWNHRCPGIVVNYIEKPRYLDALIKADKGELGPLLSFFMENFRKQNSDFFKFIQTKSSDNFSEDESVIENTSEYASRKLSYLDEENYTEYDPLEIFLSERIEDDKKFFKDDFDNLYNSLLSLKEELLNRSKYFENDIKSRHFGYRMEITDYTMIDFDTYYDLLLGNDCMPKWFVKLKIYSKNTNIELLLVYQHTRTELSAISNTNEVSLALYKEREGEFEKLKNQPIRIREICFSGNKTFTYHNDGTMKLKDCYAIVTDIILDVVKEYLS